MALFSFLKARPHEAAARSLYECIVHQARRPEFYIGMGVPDTVDGRFDLIAVHAFLVMHRLKDAGAEARALSQALFDIMFADMDQNLREMGVGDMGVGPKVKRMAKAYYGRVAAYEAGLAGGDEVLVAALRRNLFRKTEPDERQLTAMAAYMRRERQALERQESARLLEGRVVFGEPESDLS